MNISQLLLFVILILAYLAFDWKPLSKTSSRSRYIAIGISVGALLIWGYQSSRLPQVYPGAILEQLLEPFIPIDPISVPRKE